MAEVVDAAGYQALQSREWQVPQGADTVNALRYGTKTGDDPIVYPNLTAGWSARAQMRDAVGGEVWVDFSSDAVAGPRIELAADGYFTVILPHDVTEDEAWNSRRSGVYDVELTDPDDNVIRHTTGRVRVFWDVTRTEVAP
ncbi:hypothetical protein LGT39_02830 [Demequina sp. TTPB684]|uniref:hypothetical protein n=1 Tax=unclassified Demequina TaxID=2620311 RepID=UPI001CF35F32|nr:MULTISPECIES: hypothetical protein [unclassified Demequina]MCB2411783.1 hypothetical protein [Demequina sp. TTPB684]UPU89012.1 hypothetical protein LGT36_003560 [Demequina sp. TMPB413]